MGAAIVGVKLQGESKVPWVCRNGGSERNMPHAGGKTVDESGCRLDKSPMFESWVVFYDSDPSYCGLLHQGGLKARDSCILW